MLGNNNNIQFIFVISSQPGLRSSLGPTSSLPGSLVQTDGNPLIMPPMEVDEETSSEEEEDSIDPPIQRDDLRNPFWIEDKDLTKSPRGHLKMDEIEFWKGT